VRALCHAGLGVVLGVAALAQPAPEWQRAWIFDGFDCPRCSPDDRAWLVARHGQQVVFGPTSFINPLYEDCPAGVDYADLRPRSAPEIQNYFGKKRLPAMISPSPVAGRIQCAQPSEPPNTVARVVLDGPRGFLLHESGAVLRLR
jgi:hypothetical protein